MKNYVLKPAYHSTDLIENSISQFDKYLNCWQIRFIRSMSSLNSPLHQQLQNKHDRCRYICVLVVFWLPLSKVSLMYLYVSRRDRLVWFWEDGTRQIRNNMSTEFHILYFVCMNASVVINEFEMIFAENDLNALPYV